SQGKLPRLAASYRGPGKLSADRDKLPRFRESYRGLRQVSAAQGKLPRLAVSGRGRGKVSADRGKLARARSACQNGGSWPAEGGSPLLGVSDPGTGAGFACQKGRLRLAVAKRRRRAATPRLRWHLFREHAFRKE